MGVAGIGVRFVPKIGGTGSAYRGPSTSSVPRKRRVVAQFEQVLPGVILRDFSPEEPALSEVEGIWRASAATPGQRGVSASRQILHGLKAVQDDASG